MKLITRLPLIIAALLMSHIVMAAPVRIISLSPSSTEILYAIGAGDQVVAVDQWSNFPEGVPITDLSGYKPNLESIAAFEPDLVIVSGDRNDIVAALSAINVQVIINPAPSGFDEMYAQFIELGKVTGHEQQALELVVQMKSEIEEIIADAPVLDEPLRIYHELGSNFYSVSSASFLGKIYQAFGFFNIADEADSEGYGYPQLSVEYIMQANPQLIFVPSGSDYDGDDVAARPGWDRLDAVKYDAVIMINQDIASRWGPRIVDYFRLIAEQVESLQVELKEAA